MHRNLTFTTFTTAGLLMLVALSPPADAVDLEAFEFNDPNLTELTAAANTANPGNSWVSSETNGFSDMTPSRVISGSYQILKEQGGLATNHLQIDNVTSGSVFLVARMSEWAFREDSPEEAEEEVRFGFLNDDSGTGGSTITAEMIIRREASGGIELAGRALGPGATAVSNTAPLATDQMSPFTAVLAVDLDSSTYKVYYKDGSNPSQVLGIGSMSPSRAANSVRLAANNFFANGNLVGIGPSDIIEEEFNIDRLALATTNPLTDLLTVSINRATGAMTLVNSTGQALPTLLSYSIESAAGALDASGWKAVAGNYDSAGNGSVDIDGTWSVDTTTAYVLSESANTASGGALAAGQSVVLNQTGDSVWLQSPIEDIAVTLTFAGGVSRTADVMFMGNGGSRFALGDLNFDGQVTAADWSTLIMFNETDLTSLSQVEAYRRGDLDADGVNSILDIGAFKSAYDTANGSGAFAAMIAGVPEPAATLLAIGALTPLALRRRTASLLVLLTLALAGRGVQAGILEDFTFNEVDGTALNEATNLINPDNTWTENTTDLTPTAVLDNKLRVTKLNDSLASNYLDISNVTSGKVWLVAEISGWHFSSIVGPTEFDSGELEEFRFDFLDNDDNSGSTITAEMEIERKADGSIVLQGQALGGGSTVSGTTLGLSRSTPFTMVLEYDATANAYEIFGKDGAGSFESYGAGTTSATRDANSVRFAVNNSMGGTGEFFDLDRIYVTDESPIVDVLDPLTLRVNTTTGQMWIVNNSTAAYAFDSYRVSSDTDALLSADAKWSSLSDQGVDSVDGDDADSIVGNGIGETWDEAGGAGPGVLAESFLFGSSELSPSEMLSLGRPIAPGVSTGLEFTYRRADTGALQTGLLEFVTGGGLQGDFNNDGVVDAADYTLWRDNEGDPDESAIGNNGDGGGIGPGDYLVWKNNYGAAASSASVAEQAPEPGCLVLAGLAGGVLARQRRVARR
ncbi:hypothetical protein Pla123a_11080 [Posidoniimonas polymericola]|uniref:PEP-CTERM protein-sorting domain-containing protein n=1 Tax=Posidoniimonas polymericola TaxID=2528002 RepID=A0A5C5YUU2_9BACT|nr:hypothetical protein [Posidoniimonas polymericola]TWT78317.1 hypothetical protein Pla123a_11080 [Posidoniimonas polymericola]